MNYLDYSHETCVNHTSGPEVMKKFSCLTHKFIVGILTFMSRKNSILGLSEPGKKLNFLIFYTYKYLKLHAEHEKSFITSAPGRVKLKARSILCLDLYTDLANFLEFTRLSLFLDNYTVS